MSTAPSRCFECPDAAAYLVDVRWVGEGADTFTLPMCVHHTAEVRRHRNTADMVAAVRSLPRVPASPTT